MNDNNNEIIIIQIKKRFAIKKGLESIKKYNIYLFF